MILAAVWLGLAGVKEVTLQTAETHRTDRIVTRGVYAFVRHPQHLAGLIAHLGITFLLSAYYSLLSFPPVVLYIYVISRKEEAELIKEFGEEYLGYRSRAPML